MVTAVFNKFDDYSEQSTRGVHNWGAHTFKAALTNVAPIVGNKVLADITQIAAGAGYVAGGYALDSVAVTRSGGTTKVSIADEVITATGGDLAAFRYAVVYNDSPTSPADPLVCWFDYGGSTVVKDGESFTLDFDQAAGFFTIT